MDNTCKINALFGKAILDINTEGPEEIDSIMSMTLTEVIDQLREIVEEIPEENRDMTLGELIGMVLEDDPEETDSETEDPAE